MDIKEADLALGDGRVLHYYVAASEDGPAAAAVSPLSVFWHHGTPNIGSPPEPLFPESERLGIRWVSYDRPGYGGSTTRPGRDIASAAGDVAALADALGIGRFAIMGHSGGGPHALACGALLAERVLAVVSVAGLAPFGSDALDWYTGMAPSVEASLRAAAEGREVKERFEAAAEYNPDMFTEADHAALAGNWSWLGKVVGPAIQAGPAAPIDDDLAYVSPWGFDPANVTAPVLLVHGDQDRVVPSSHSGWLAATCPAAEMRRYPDDGHISVLNAAGSAVSWLHQHAR
jgi:pimeloyl-ACP methyl ester carboxylesterase